MNLDGMDISHHGSNHIDEYLKIDFSYVITVCDHAKVSCSYFPTSAVKHHYNFSEPAKASRTKEKPMEQFRNMREMIKIYAQQFLH